MTARPRGAALLSAVSVGAALAIVFFGRFPPAALSLSRLVRPLAAAILVLLASLGTGSACVALARRLFRRFARLPERGETADAGDLLLVGVPAYGTLSAAIAWWAPSMEAVILAATLVLAAAGALVLRATFRGARGPRAPEGPTVLWLAIPVLFALAEAVTPVASPDELVYKLAVPHEYRLYGRMLELPLNSHSYYPAALSLSSLPALLLSGGIAAKLVFFAVFLLSLRVARRLADRIEPGAGNLAAAILAWSPALMLIAGWCWVEWGMIGLLLLSYEAWDRFRDEPRALDAAVCAAALAGALGSKYSAVPWLAVFAVAAALGTRGLPIARSRVAAAAALVLLLLGGLFYVRNTVWTGSPVAPFLLPESPRLWHFRSDSVWGGWRGLLRGDDVLYPGIVDDSLGILLPAAVLLSPLALRRRRYRDLFALGAIQLVGFVTFAPMSRLLTTALAPLALLGAAAISAGRAAAGRTLRALAGAGTAIVLAGQALLVAFVLVVSYDFFPYLVGQETESQYLARTRDFARPYAFLAKAAPESARVLLLGENRTFYLDRPALAAGNLDGPRLAAYLARFPDAAAFDAEMRRLGVTHLLRHAPWYRVAGANASAPDKLESEYVLEVSPGTDRMLAEYLASKTTLRYRDAAGYEIYELRIEN